MSTTAFNTAAQTITPQASAAMNPYVLLVDDHEPSLQQLHALVKLSGRSCVSARSGSEALRWCDCRRPRVVVTDLTMPNLDGRALARWLQARHPSVPMILMTGQAVDARTLGELERTFTAVLTKPIDVDYFLGLLDRLMPAAAIANRKAVSGRP
jgi:CheY-like chemotaxis protein